MLISVKEITKLGKTSLSDFTLCEAKLLHKLPKQLEESPQRFFQTCTNSLIVCVDCVGMFGSMEVIGENMELWDKCECFVPKLF